jgi:hypothetical protein
LLAATSCVRRVFFPASGLRDPSNGSSRKLGTDGIGWSSTQVNATNGYNLGFTSTASNPANNNSKAYGFTVRCVQEIIPHAPPLFQLPADGDLLSTRVLVVIPDEAKISCLHL